MFVARSIAADHRDLIHDVSFDFHGRRMATCSSDQSVKVWDKGENGEWHCTASWKTHSGSVWRVTWAHPEFGQVLASCSFDRTAAVWEEIVGESNDKLRGQSHWVKRTTLVDSRTSVTDVKFAPKHMGLMLATCSADGVVRIYEAPDVMNLSQWSLQHEISCKLSCSCISWNPSSCRAHAPMIAVGSDDSSPNVLAKVQIYEYNENTRKYAKAETLMTVTDPVHDIAFAPNLGRSFHILAVATKDVRIFTLKPVRKELTATSGLTKFEVQLVAQFDNHNSQVWRVSWNITGTVLASSGDDGCVRLWKANYMDNWKCTGILKGNGSPVNASSSQQGVFNAPLGTANPSLQNSVNGTSAGRYFFPPLDSPRAGSRWSSYAQLLPPPPLIEHSCDADTANLQYPHPRRRYISRPLNLLREHEGHMDMEDFRYIADETFPSFLANSLTSRTSEIWDNITIASNLGLPVAASTEARQKTGCHERHCDQASYVEERLSVPSPNSGESPSDPRRKLALNLQDSVGSCKNPVETLLESELVQKEDSDTLERRKKQNCNDECLGNNQDTLCEILPLEHLEDLTTGICSFSKRKSQDGKVSSLKLSYKWIKNTVDDNDEIGFSSLIENEKLIFASLEDNSSDGDIGDEEFCDDQLEAYFEKLALPEMQEDDIEQDELDKCIKTGELLPEEGKFQILNVCQAATRMDSPDSDEDLHEFVGAGHSAKSQQFMLHLTAAPEEDECLTLEQDLLRNDSSDKPVEMERIIPEISITAKESPLIHSGIVDVLDGGGEDRTALKTNIFNNGRKVTTEDAENQIPYVSPEDTTYDRDVPNITNCAELKLDSLYFKCIDGNNAASELWNTEEQDQSSYLYQVADDSNVPLAAEYLSPTVCQTADLNQEESSPNVVYQNEEGRWVTDLAYYTSFNKEQVSSLLYTNENFFTGSEAIDMIAKDQEEFEREHRFMQEEQIDSQNMSELKDTSWKSVSSYNAVRASQAEDFSKDASYLRLTLGEFFGQRSEALGCLGGDGDVKRPSFGYHITSPEKRQPVALLRESTVSRANSDEPSTRLSNTPQGNLEHSIKEESHTASTTFILSEKDILASKTRSINMQSDTKSKMQEAFGGKKVESMHSELKSPVLSISTIASAIANASVSAEPSQLAAMIMALLNNTRERNNILEAGNPADFSVISQFLASNVENSTINMEKYLRRTEDETDTKFKSFFNHEDVSRDCQKSVNKQECQITGNLSKSNLYREEKQHLEKKYEENCSKHKTCDASSEKKNCIEYLDSYLEAVSNTCSNFQSEQLTTIAPSSEERSGCAEVLLEGGITKMTHAAHFEPEGRTSTSTSPLNLKSVSVLVSPLPACPHKEKVTHEVQYKNKQNGRIQKKNSACNSEKHVTFDKLPIDNQQLVGEALVETDEKPASPIPCMQISDEQYSFRPSTSPLTHSSPSESSGTILSGCEVDYPCTTPNFKHSAYNDSSLPQSAYSSPSLERLTFLSASENTTKNLALSRTERCQSNGSNELSTTIVWTSPSSALEQDTEKKNITLQANKIPLVSTTQKSLSKKLEADESTEPNSQSEDQKSSAEFASKSKDQFAHICPNMAPSNNELCQVDAPITRHDYTNTAQGLGLPSLNMLPTSRGFDGCIPLNQNTGNLKSHNAASEIPGVPSVMPTLLTGCSLRATPFAQQYMGSFPSSANITSPQYHLGCPPVLGLPTGLIYSSIPMGHHPNSLAAGMPLGPDTRSGLLGTTPHYKFTSNPHILSSKSGTMQDADIARPRQWETSVPFEFGQVRVPEEIKFCNACCVGLTSQTVLSLLNPSERWLQVCIDLRSVTLNGEKMEPLKHGCLLFKNKTIIGPCTTEEIKILFLPCQAGVFQCVLSVASWPFSADAETIVQAEALAARVILNAVAENPELEVETNQLDFGDLPSGSWKALPLKLINKTHARVPVRLVINANAVAWRYFTFSKEPINFPIKSTVHTYNISQLAAPSVISHVMNPSYDEQDPEAVIVWVQFHAPSKRLSSDFLGPADEYLARIDVEVDCPEPTNILSIPLCARSGTPRIYAPKGLQTLHVSARIGSSTRQQLPLKNAGNIKVDLKIMTLEPSNSISVEPEELSLIPGEEQEVTVRFSPKDCRSTESVVKIFVLPSGPEYKVTVKAEVPVVDSKPFSQMCHNSEVPPILANKQLVAWGGVQLGRTVQQKLILRNDSQTTTQQLRLLIRGQDQDCFQMKLGEHVYSNCEIKIRPKHDYSVSLMFTPSRLACMFAKLEMKQLGFPTRLGIKFTIPLYGYGGKSCVILEGVKKHCNRYLVELNELSPGETSQVSFSLNNTGCRAAYVKALCFRNFSEGIIMDPNMLNLFPEKFVLKEGEQQKVTVTCNSAKSEQHNAPMLSTICFFYGDEISRQQYLRAIKHNPEEEQNILPANNPVTNVKFDEEFPGEKLVTEVCDLPQQINGIQCFFINMRRIILSVYKASSSATLNAVTPSAHLTALDRHGVPEKQSMTLDVLPVKGPHACVLPSNVSSQNENKLVSQGTWSVQPEFLCLSAPSLSGATDTRHTQITNHSNRSLKFELSWPAHCLTITPQHGTIEPGSCISIYVSPNPSLAENKLVFPWSGHIYIHCDNGQKFVRVQIRENTSEEQSRRNPTVPNLGARHHNTELPVNVIKPLQKPPSTQLEIKNRTIVFPETKSSENSEKRLEFENNGNESVKWFLTSFAPPYVKGVDESGEVYRATYTAFQCSCSSGTLEAQGKEKVVIMFLPRDRGDYSQFWDLECHPLHEPHLKDKHRLQFSGVGIVENETLKNEVSSALVKVSVPLTSQRREYPDTSDPKAREGVYAQDGVHTFPSTRVGESSMLKIRMRNYSTSSNMLKFLRPREPFYIKHSHYNLRCHHYCNLPVFFRPVSAGIFKSLLVVQTEKNDTLTIQLIGEGLPQQ
ncbi:centrosomal protein of 192 kDa [Eublepharis macularius]|uniref:Centrosomal protein of 192 kDa n=1 Tax=Eublepharis macularius TaxID=481883 RepID=A0AA97JRJ2_EUBMA|nr:centrosomal protein of 192 kDa [Eublepharis macularius]